MEKFIQIGNRKIGLGYEPLVIAEIGINHEGSLKTAFEMVDAAYEGGAEIIKHQTHVIEDEMSKEAKKVIPGNTDVSIYDVMARCALNEEDKSNLKEYVESKGMIFLSTPFSRAAADRLERMEVLANKIGSGEMNNYPLLDHVASVAKGASETAIEKFKMFLDRITNDAKVLVSVRNDGSYETIQKLYGDVFDKKIYRVPDGAFFMKSKTFDFPELNDKYRSLGINVVSDMKEIRFSNNIDGGISYDDFIRSYASELNSFLKHYPNYQLILFPHIYSDLIAIYNLLEKIEDQYRRKRVVIAPCLTGEGSDEYIFGLYKECDFIMGMRFHSNVCAIAQNIPTIALSSYKKINDLYREVGLSDRVVEVNKYGFEKRIREKIKSTIMNLEDIRSSYSIVNKNIYQESGEFYDAIKKWYTT